MGCEPKKSKQKVNTCEEWTLNPIPKETKIRRPHMKITKAEVKRILRSGK